MFIETKNDIFSISKENFILKSFGKKRWNSGIFYTVTLVLFFGEDSSNISIFNNVDEIFNMQYIYNDECQIYKNLKRIGYYKYSDNLKNLRTNFDGLLDEKDFDHNIFKKNGDTGYYYYNITEHDFGYESKTIIKIK